ncbi:ATP-binding protein [Arcobacter arenosus]|uniref:histidine kinase n=1 Tax=Arcobacter arenosus TaxID=2576037 RepID=A0A5R8Y2S4_9BACT|nr:ATP-binding protein [Arcobacter arenosus]TLP39170.1 PAS domain-containing protein [Arcobacter arenosus]
MIKNNSLQTQLLVSILLSIIIGIGAIFYLSYNDLKKEIDSRKTVLYEEKIDNIIYLIEQKYQKLLKTQMVESYEKAFKDGTLKAIKEIFDKDEKDIYPFVIDENKNLVIHRKYNVQNSNLYKNQEEYKKILNLKNGNFLINRKNDERWIVFKSFEPWDWIVGYRINLDEKYSELNKFRQSFLIISLIVLSIISLIIILIVKNVLKPIDNLSDATKEILAGNLNTKIEISGVKELKELSSNFEKMRNHILFEMEALLKSEKEIEGLNKNLQQLVEERTLELKEQKEVFETLFNDSKDGLSMLSFEDGKYIDCNKAFLEIFGLKDKSEIIGKSPYAFSPEYQKDGLTTKEALKEVSKEFNKNGSARFEWIHKKPNNEEFWTEIILSKIVLDSQLVIYGTVRDISEKKDLEEQLHYRNIDLQESNDELETIIENLRETQNKLIESEKLAGLGSLVAGVAHEISTPVGVGLTGSSHLEFLAENILNKYQSGEMSEEDLENYLKTSKELVSVINSNLNRTADIIRNFKQVAVDQTSEQKRLFKVKEYIRGLLISIDSLMQNKKIDINIDCDEDLEIISYPGFFAQIITNLVVNSLNHGFKNRNSGKIDFKIEKIDNNLNFRYSDNGIGIKQENLLKIYEPFFTTNRQEGSSGLGLNIIYNLVTTNLKGSIDCQSELDKGVKFTIKIPL